MHSLSSCLKRVWSGTCLALYLGVVSISLASSLDMIQKVQPPDDGVVSGDFSSLISGDGYGFAMAVSSEWAVVGAPQDTCGIAEGATNYSGFRAGSVYLFKLVNGIWIYQQKIRRPVPSANSYYGRAVALNGNTLAVASNRNPTQTGTSSVHVYVRTADVWSLETELIVPGETFTASVLILEGNTLLAANPDGTGSVHVFERSGQVWASKGNLGSGLSLPTTSRFGSAIALSGNTAFVGAPGNSQQPGRIYEFTRSAGEWSRTRTIVSPAGSVYDDFGRAIAFVGGSLVSGARQPAALTPNPSTLPTTGRVYVFSFNMSSWTLVRTIERPTAITAMEWGGVVLPGNNRVILGANTNGGDGKAAFQSLEMLGSVPANWTLRTLPNPVRGAFGVESILASFGDLVWCVKRPFLGQEATDGFVDRLSFVNSTWRSDGVLAGPPPSQLEANPTVMAPAGEDLVAGSPSWNDGGRAPGIVHVYASVDGRWQLKQTLHNPDPESIHNFGRAISYSKEYDRLAISARDGRIYVYVRLPDRSWSLSHRITGVGSIDFGYRMGWDGKFLHVFDFDGSDGSTIVIAYEVGDVFATLAPSRALHLIGESSPTVGENTLATISYPPLGAFNGALVIRRYDGHKWGVSQRLLLPAKAYGGVIHGMTPETIVLDELAGSNAADPNPREVLTSTFRSGRWQALQKLKLPEPLGLIDNNIPPVMAIEGRTMLISASGNTKLAVQTTAGDWRFQRWLDLPTSGESYYTNSVALVGSSAAAFSRESVLSLIHIEIMRAEQMDVHDGPVTTSTLITSGSSFDWSGPVLVGKQTSRRLTLRNSGTSSYQVQARIEGAHASDFQLSGLPVGMLHPGDEAVLTLTLKPGATGLRDARLIVTPVTDSLPEWMLDIDGQGTGTMTIPTSSQGILYSILKRGAAGLLEPTVTGTRPFAVEWRKDGRLLKGLTQEVLWLPNAQPADAGEYELRVSNEAGQSSVRMLVAVYDPVNSSVAVKSGTPLRLTTRFWGPGNISWSLPESATDLPAVFSGRLSPTLTVLAPMAALNYAQQYGDSAKILKATLRLGAMSQIIAEHYLDDNLPPYILSVPGGERAVTGGADGGVVVESFSPIPRVFSASGLPAGMSISEYDGTVSGNFSQPGTYRVTWRVKNDYGQDSMTSTFQVSDTPKRLPMPGTYAGLIANVMTEPDLDAPSGYVQVQMGSEGAFTGQWRFKGVTRRFSGRYVPLEIFGNEPGAIVPLGSISPDARNAHLRLDPVYVDSAVRIDVSLSYTLSDNSETGVSGELLKVVRLSRHEQQLFTGIFSGLLTPQSPTVSVPLGSGISSLSISSDGSSASGVGALADGLGFTFSSVLPVRQSLDVPSLPVYFHDPTTKSTLFGWMSVSIESSLYWKHSPKPGSRLYPDGFAVVLSNQFLKRRGLAAGELLLSDSLAETQNARLTADWDVLRLLDTTFMLTSGHKSVFPAPNSRSVSLDFYAPTGFFTGKFNTQKGPDTAVGTVYFRGMMLPGLNTGGGFFLLPKLPNPGGTTPTTSSTASILSGRVSVSPHFTGN